MPYIVFNLFITIVNLFSTLFYCYLAAFRIEIFFQHDNYDHHNYKMFVITTVFEAFIGMNILINFFLTYTDERTQKKVTKPRKLYRHYLKGNFVLDFIPLIPLQLIQLKNNRHTLFYLIKLIRLYNCYKLFNVSAIMKTLRVAVQKRSLEGCQC